MHYCNIITLAPKGAHVILLFCQYFPLECDQEDGKMKEDFVNAVISSIEKYAPGFKDSIIGKDVLSPLDLEKHLD
jgi:phytoene dehydrogenase-like protein